MITHSQHIYILSCFTLSLFEWTSISITSLPQHKGAYLMDSQNSLLVLYCTKNTAIFGSYRVYTQDKHIYIHHSFHHTFPDFVPPQSRSRLSSHFPLFPVQDPNHHHHRCCSNQMQSGQVEIGTMWLFYKTK